MYKLNPEVQYDQTYLHVLNLLKGLNSIYTVICELNKNYNLHYHGTIQFFSKSLNHRFDFKNKFRNDKYIGYVDIRQITDGPGWTSYLKKELQETRQLVNRPSVLYDGMYLLNILDEFMVQQ